MNCCSIRSQAKRGLLHALIAEHRAEIIIGCETHLDATYLSSEIFPSHFNVIRKDRNEGSGGVFIAYNSDIPIVEEPLLNGDAEMIWAKLCVNNCKPVYICSFYRPPNNLTTPITNLRASLSKITTQNPDIVVAGDFNFPDIEWKEGIGCISPSPTYGRELNHLFAEVVNDSGLEQFVTQATRNNHVLDLVFTTTLDLIYDVNVVPGISDHEAVSFKIKLPSYIPSTKQLRKVYHYHRANIDRILEEMNLFSSTFLSQEPHQYSVESNWLRLKSILLHVVELYVPHKTINPYKDLPWMNRNIKAQMRKRKRLYNKARCTKSPADWTQYKIMRNVVNKSLRQAHEGYCQHLFDNSFTNNRKRFWSLVKRSHKSYQSVAPLEVNNSLKITPTSKAETLGEQFFSVFTRENNSIPVIPSTQYPPMPNVTFNTKGIESLLKDLKPGKAAGPDEIPTWILKTCAEQIAPVLQVIFTQSLNSSTLPNDWLTANIIPAFKKGSKSTPANYRPISLTVVCCKIMEHIIFHSIMDHLNIHNIINPNQHGFRPGFSCNTQLMLLVDDILKAMDNHLQVDLVLLDFSKAFDTVAHKKLLHKLSHYGIQSNIHKWITTWLTSRTQRVLVEGCTSSSKQVLSGVPQGTVLGPLMFLLYINDIDTSISSSIRLFADDCVLYRVIKSPQDNLILQQDLTQLAQWTDTWQMRLNIEKCVTMTCTRSPVSTPTVYSIHEHPLNVVDQHDYLGVRLHSSMTWSHHIQLKVNKATKVLNLIKRTLHKCTKEVKETAYFTLVRPILEYTAIIWDPYQQYLIDSIEKIQRRAARWVMGDYRLTSSVSEMISTLQWPSLEQRRLHNRLTMFYNFVNKATSIDIPLHYHPYTSTHNTRYYHPLHYMIPWSSTSYYQMSFFPKTIRDWNSLPHQIIESESVNIFSHRLSRHI